MRFRLYSLLILLPAFLTVSAQYVYTENKPKTISETVVTDQKEKSGESWFKANNVLDHLDVAFTLGTPGMGLELQAPVTKWTNVRVGFDGIPQIKLPMHFSVATYAEGKVEDNFEKIQEFMYKMTGEEMHQYVKVNGRPKMFNFKFLVDVFPFRNRHWHVTAGFYLGGRTVATAVSAKGETSTLVAMNIYNKFYNRLKEHGYDEEPIFGDIYLSPEMYKELMSYGEMGIHVGDFRDGTPYYLKPSKNGTVSAKAFANAFKPYIGFGYNGAIDKEKKFNVGFEAGLLFWGGSPDIILNDGLNMTKELINVRGKVGDYFYLMKALKVYPSVSFKISYNIF